MVNAENDYDTTCTKASMKIFLGSAVEAPVLHAEKNTLIASRSGIKKCREKYQQSTRQGHH